MRPLRLELEGFGPYRTRQAVDFSDVELFVLTGPTGAGKTTILDAIAFALYAKTPRGFKKYGELVHPGAELARVQLVFQVGGGVYRVTRAVGKKSEHRLEVEEGGRFRALPETEKAKALAARLERLLGLSFDAFTRAILLPQGEFDRFLKGEPKERRALLASLFGLETLAAMRERAREHRDAVAKRIERLEGELLGLGEGEDPAALREELETRKAELDRLEAELASAEKALSRLEDLAKRFRALSDLRRNRDAILAREEEMQALAERLRRAEAAARMEPELERLLEEERRIEGLASELRKVEARLEKLRPEYEALVRRADPGRLEALVREASRLEGLLEKRRWLERLGPPAGEGEAAPFDPLLVQELLEARRAHAELERKAGELRRLEAEREQLAKEVEALLAEQKRVEAEGKRVSNELSSAEEALKAAEVRAGLAAYHEHLRPGEPCPLCGRVVEAVPPKPEVGELEPLRRRVAELTERLEALRERYKELRAEAEAKKREAERLGKELEKRAREIEDARARLPERAEVEARLEAMKRGLAAELGGGDPAERIRALKAEEAELKRALEQKRRLEEELSRLERSRAGLLERRAEAERGLSALKASFEARLAEAGFAGVDELKASLLKEDERARLSEALLRYERAREEVEAKLKSLEAELEGEEEPSKKALLEAEERVRAMRERYRKLGAEVGELAERLRRLEAEEKRRRALLKERAELERELAVWERLVADLRSDRFPEYLIHHYQRGLVERASEILAELYQGRYRLLAQEGDYFVEDTWTKSVRPVRTLSGGESFLASLALALALSERLSGGKLGALFLDEGFGTLDRETLEFAAGVLETLPTRGRLVGIVTHVAELAERIPERLVVEKSPSGSRVYWAS